MNVTIADLSAAQAHELHDLGVRLRLLRERQPDLFAAAMERAREYVCAAEPERIAEQLFLFNKVLAAFERKAEAPAAVPIEGVDRGGGRDGGDDGDRGRDLRESVLRLGAAWS